MTQLCVYMYAYIDMYIYTLEKAVAAPSSALAWRILLSEEPGGLLSMGSRRVGHDCSDLAAAAYILFYIIFIMLSHKMLNTVLCAATRMLLPIHRTASANPSLPSKSQSSLFPLCDPVSVS